MEIFHVDYNKIEEYTKYEDDNINKYTIKLLNNISKIMNNFYDYLDKEKIFFRGQAYKYVSKNLKNQNYRIAFCGFNALNKSEEIIMKHFLEQDSIMILQSNVDEWEKDVNSPFYFHNLLKEKWGFNPEIICEEEIKETEINIFEAPYIHSEVLALKDINKENTAIVLPDNNTLLPVIYRVKDLSIDKFNVSMGFPFAMTPVYSLFKVFIKIFLNMDDRKIYIRDYIDFIRNPYIKRLKIKNIEISEIIYIVERKLMDNHKNFGLSFASIEDIEDIVRNNLEENKRFEYFKEFNSKFIKIFKNVKSVREITENLLNVFKFIFDNQDYKDNIFLNQFLSVFFDKLENISNSLIGEYVSTDKKGMWNLIDMIVKDITIPFSGEPLVGLQILGFLETRCLNFDNVYMLDVNEGIIPKNKKIDPILPFELRCAIGLPDYKQDESMFAYNFYRLIYGAKNVCLIYTNAETGETDNYRSRFIEKIIWENEKMNKKIEVSNIVLPANYIKKEKYEYKKNEKLMEILKNEVYSGTKLDTYLRCPMKFLLRYVLKIESPVEIEDDIKGDKIGIFVHKLFKVYFEPFIGKKANEKDKNGFFLIFDNEFDEFFKEYDKTKKIFLKEALKRRLEKMYQTIDNINSEKICYLEKEIESTITLNGKEIKLKGIMDRIDMSVDNCYIIIDYKTGSNVETPKKLDNIKKEIEKANKFLSREEVEKNIKTLQPSCYIYLFSRYKNISPEKIKFYFVRFNEIKKVSPCNSNKGENKKDENEFKEYLNYPEYLGYLENGLKFVLSEILDPEIPFYMTDNEKTCLNCDYVYFCGKKKKDY